MNEGSKRSMRRRWILSAALLATVAGLAVALAGAFRSGDGAWVPAGVKVIQVRGGWFSFRITDPVQVGKVVTWFDELKGETGHVKCAPAPAPDVAFAFLGG